MVSVVAFVASDVTSDLFAQINVNRPPTKKDHQLQQVQLLCGNIVFKQTLASDLLQRSMSNMFIWYT